MWCVEWKKSEALRVGRLNLDSVVGWEIEEGLGVGGLSVVAVVGMVVGGC